MKTVSKKSGKKYMIIGEHGMFGSEVLFSDRITHFPAHIREGISKGYSVLFRADDNKIVWINLNGSIRR